ncbi:MAG: pirin family protein [Chitinophagales bacterium]|nr:pirin family protein [Chitinophagales bacterium]MCZ2394803.1 pirin family protein [Chitinophagales bacterium]
MKNIHFYPASLRGGADHGWLKTHHSFSFAQYYNPENIHFGTLRVLNDDYIEGGMGFGRHPHDNMEIITIPLSGALEHKDSMGNSSVIRTGEIQVMSAGTGIYHSEFNHLSDTPTEILQIWLFPREKNLKPRYDQWDYSNIFQNNQLVQILSPNEKNQGVWIHQDAWFYLGKFDNNISVIHPTQKEGNGLYLFVIEGSFEIEGHILHRRDAISIENAEEVVIKSTQTKSMILIMDITMQLPK